VVGAILLGVGQKAQAQVSLDTSFGTNGIATFDFGGAYDDVQGMSIAPDGKIWAVGTGGTSNRFAVARLTTGGQLDNTFSGDGKLIINSSAGANGVQGLASGKVLLGVPRLTPDPRGFQAIQLTNSGAFDGTFGSAGTGFIETGGSQVNIDRLMVQPDGKILIGGYDFLSDGWNFVLTRFNANGSVDTGFGTSGKVITDFSRAAIQNPIDRSASYLLQPDGKILAGGFSSTTSAESTGNRIHAIARYLPDGSLDSTFGTGGKQTFTFSTGSTQQEQVGAMVLQPDGKILGTSNGGSTTALFRLNTNGSVDTTFGTGGQIVSPTSAPWRDSSTIVLDNQGRILLGGGFSVTRLTPAGAVDTTFGSNGTFDINIGTTVAKYVTNLEFDADGKLVVGGSSTISFNVDSNWNIARLNYGTAPPTNNLTIAPTFDVKAIPGATPSITDGETGLFAGLGFDAQNPEERPILEFPLSGLPAGATITAATLKLDPYNSSGSPRLEVQSFAGDGLASLSDITSAGQVVGTTGPVSASDPSIDISLTPSIMQSYFGTASHLGLRIRSLDLPLYVGFGSSEATFGTPPQLVLTYSLAATGDFNNDGMVNASDYVTWRNGLGTTYTPNDYSVWKSHFGQTIGSGSSSTATVPEPATAVLLLCAAMGLARRREARRCS